MRIILGKIVDNLCSLNRRFISRIIIQNIVARSRRMHGKINKIQRADGFRGNLWTGNDLKSKFPVEREIELCPYDYNANSTVLRWFDGEMKKKKRS